MNRELEQAPKTDWAMHLPPDFAAQLRAMRPPTTRRQVPPMTLRITLAAARARGWTLQSLADALDLTRERIRQLVQDVSPAGNAVGIPEPPPRPLTKRERTRLDWAARVAATPMLNAEQRAELLALQRKANAGGNCSPDHPAIVAGCELAALIQGYLDKGYRTADIASACGVSVAAIHMRLGRFGYKPLPPSLRHSPGPIAAAIAARQAVTA